MQSTYVQITPCLWNQLPSSLRQPHSSPSVPDLPVHAPATSSYSFNLPFSPSITRDGHETSMAETETFAGLET